MSNPQRVAILHYHLRPGGVTRVIEHAQTALASHGVRTVALSGAEVPGLAYGVPASKAEETLIDLRCAARAALGGEPELWHIHNHSIGKNATLPRVVDQLASEGCALCLQPHDFAEDGRPSNYAYLRDELGASFEQRLYPEGPRIHYALLTRRDHEVLRGAGATPGRLHTLPNAVALESDRADPGPEKPPLLLYPSRAIRRKNIGEFLLWSALAEGEERFAVTLAPDNEEARAIYDGWVALASELNLPVTFEYGVKHPGSFLDVLRSATAHATTSVAEGFGLAFLEGWLAGRPLVGRNLPDITSDFEEEGLDLSSLYTTCPVPLEVVGETEWRQTVGKKISEGRLQYGRETHPKHSDAACDAAMKDGMVDFGRLDEALQASVIRKVAGSSDLRRSFDGLASWSTAGSRGTIDKNVAVVRERYSLEKYGERLIHIYQQACDGKGGATGHLDGNMLLDTFLDPSYFYLLRT